MYDAQFTDYLVETISLILLPVAVLMCGYALTVFIWRARAIAKKQVRILRPSSASTWKVLQEPAIEQSRGVPEAVLRKPADWMQGGLTLCKCEPLHMRVWCAWHEGNTLSRMLQTQQ